MNSIVDACLKSINSVNENEFEAELNACNALLEGYEKAIRLMEYCGTDNLQFPFLMSAEVITEAEAQQNPQPAQNAQPAAQPATQTQNTQQQATTANNTSNGNKPAWEFNARPNKKDGSGKENLFISILAFIPRLIFAVVKFIGRSIQNLFSGKKASDAAAQNITNAAAQANSDTIYSDEALLKMFEEAGIQGFPPFKFVRGEYHTGNFQNAVITNDANGNPVELNIIVPFNIADVVVNMKTLATDICDQLIKMLNTLFSHRTEEGNLKVATLKNEDIAAFENKIGALIKTISSQNETIAQTEEKQSNSKSLIVSDENGNLSVKGYKPSAIWDNLSMLTQIQKLITDKNTKIEALVKKFEETDNRATPEEGSLENLKKCIENLKKATTLACGQVSKVGSYISRYQSALNAVNNKLSSGGLTIFKPKTDATEAEALQNSAKNAPAQPGAQPDNGQNNNQNVQNAVDQTANTGDTRSAAPPANNGQAPKGLQSTDLNRTVGEPGPGLFSRMGNSIKSAGKKAVQGVQNVGKRFKNTIKGEGVHYAKYKNPDTGAVEEKIYRNMDDLSFERTIQHLKNSGYEVLQAESFETVIGIDEDGNRYEVTMEEFNESYPDMEILTEQEYLIYQQFENISALEY